MWKESYKIGVELIDTQHRELFRMVENLLIVLDKNNFMEKKQEVISAIAFLKQYVVHHFQAEEAYQESIQYSGLEEHRRLHREFTAEILRQEKKVIESDFDYNILRGFAGVLTTWLIYHVADADQKITHSEEIVSQQEGASIMHCFKKSTNDVLRKIAGIQTNEVPESDLQMTSISDGVGVEIDLTGDKEGTATFIFSDELAFELIYSMTNVDSDKSDELASSILKEISNIIGGNAAARLSTENIICNIKPPLLSFQYDKEEVDESILLSTGMGNMEIRFRNSNL